MKYIPIYKYVEQNKTNKQNVYRWIRENKFQPEDVVVEEVLVKRIKIREDAKPGLSKKNVK